MKKTVFPTNLKSHVFAKATLINELCQRCNNYIIGYENASPKEHLSYTNRLMAVLLPLFKYNLDNFNFQRALDYLVVSVNRVLTPDYKFKKESKIGLLKNAISIFTLTSNMLEKLEPKTELKALVEIYNNQAEEYMTMLQRFDDEADNDIILLTKTYLGELSRHKAYNEPLRLIIQEQIIELNNEYFVENIPNGKNRPIFWKSDLEPNVFSVGTETDSLLVCRKSP